MYFFFILVKGDSSSRIKSKIFSIIIFYSQYLRTKLLFSTKLNQTSKYSLNRCQFLFTSLPIISVNFSKNYKMISLFSATNFCPSSLELVFSVWLNSLFKSFESIMSLMTHYNKFLIPILVDFSIDKISDYQFLPKFFKNSHPWPLTISLNLFDAHSDKVKEFPSYVDSSTTCFKWKHS